MQPELSIGEALAQGTAILRGGGIDAPRLTAEVLLAHALRRGRPYLVAHSEERLPEISWIHYGRWLHERLGGKPTQYITRRQEFYGRDFAVGPGVLIPRPETEHVIERALELRETTGPWIDVGTGSGCIAITLSLELRRRMFAVEISEAALSVARENARTLDADVEFVRGDLLESIGRAGLIVTNPPYVPAGDQLPREVGEWEPPDALFAGPDGLDCWRQIIVRAERILAPGGWLVGEMDSRAEMQPLFADNWEGLELRNDLSGLRRVLSVRLRDNR